MCLATEDVQFSFNDMYAQTGDVEMSGSFGLILANIFVGHHERLLFDKVHKPYVDMRCGDDAFSVFDSAGDATDFFRRTHFYPSIPSVSCGG